MFSENLRKVKGLLQNKNKLGQPSSNFTPVSVSLSDTIRH